MGVHGAEEIYETAEQFSKLCLKEDKSLLWPESNAWTLTNLDSFWPGRVGDGDIKPAPSSATTATGCGRS